MAKIKSIYAREILNSKGTPTIETTVTLSDGVTATSSVPKGVSAGSYEAVEIRDHDEMRYRGLGVLKAVSIVNSLIAPKLVGIEATHQQEIDRTMIELDGTQNKAKLGANTILSVSQAVARAAASSSVLPLFLYLRQFLTEKSTPLSMPVPLVNVMEGGKHGENVDFQEFLVVPASSKTYEESLKMATQIYSSLRDMLRVNNYSTLTGGEGGFSPRVATNFDALSLFLQSMETTNYRIGFDVFVGIDAAANSFYSSQQYKIRDKQMNLSSKNLLDYYQELGKQFHLLYLEDPLAEDDWEGWKQAVGMLAQDMLIVGDDLITTNPYRLQMALEKKAITGIVIKPNQIGTVIEALAVVEVARAAGLKIIVSQRGEETNDDFIADFAVAVGSDYCKFGAPNRGERIAKYNRLSQINEHMKKLK